MTTTRLRIALQVATSLTLAGVACIVGQAGGTWWSVLLFITAAVTADAAAHTHTQAHRLRTAQRVIIQLAKVRPTTPRWTPAAGLARLRTDLNQPPFTKDTDHA